MEKLPYLLRHENIAHIEENALYIGDRRNFPFKKNFVKCNAVEDLVANLKAMVTQGGGPLEAGLRFLQLDLQRGCNLETIKKDAKLIASARPTNTTLEKTFNSLFEKSNLENLNENIEKEFDYYDKQYYKMGNYGSSLILNKQTILTNCFAEHSFIIACLLAKEQGKKPKVICAETRPYLQGARLTAPSLEELGIEVSVITDNLMATYMDKIDMFMTAADKSFSNKTVINKIGTLSGAILCKYYHKPYYAFSIAPDYCKPKYIMEFRSGKELTKIGSLKTTFARLGKDYPAFDVIPSKLVTSIITPYGIV